MTTLQQGGEVGEGAVGSSAVLSPISHTVIERWGGLYAYRCLDCGKTGAAYIDRFRAEHQADFHPCGGAR